MAKTDRIIYFSYFDEDVTFQILKKPGGTDQVLCDHPMFLKHFGLPAVFVQTYFDFIKDIPFPDSAFFAGMTRALKAMV
jgi:hypothetical protein